MLGCPAGLPDLSWSNIPKWEKYTKVPLNYQMTIKITQWPYVGNILQMAIKYIKNFTYFQVHPKFTQICIFG
jgi:hypothetical protein